MQKNQRLAAWRSNRTEESPLVPGKLPSLLQRVVHVVRLFASLRPAKWAHACPHLRRLTQLPRKRKPEWTCVPGSYDFPMEEGPPTPLARFRGRSPAGTCFHRYAATVARFGRAILGLVHPFCTIRRSHRCGVSRPIALHTCQMLKPTVPYPCMSAVRSRRPAVSAFASESHLRSPGGISGPAGHPDGETGRSRADLECRCIGSHAASQARRSAGETPSDRSVRGESRRSDGKATTLRSSRADLAVIRAYHALGTSSHRWGCAGRSHPSHSFSRSPPTSWERGERREQVASMQPEAGIGRVLVWACCVRRTFSPPPAYCEW